MKSGGIPDGALSGQFTINANGDKVYFSKGNLQYNKNTSTWSFMENLYDTVETSNQNVGTDYAKQNIVGLFGWGTSGKTISNYGSAYQPYATDATSIDYGPTGKYSLTGDYADGDWGVNMGPGWRTMSSAEWKYLFNTRTVNGGTGYGKSYTLGQKVNNVLGVVLYPDGYTGDTYTTGSNWATFESAGCVFLPAAGYRSGASVKNVDSYGCYLSSTLYSSEYSIKNAYCIKFYSNSVNLDSSTRANYGSAVRLVYDITGG